MSVAARPAADRMPAARAALARAGTRTAPLLAALVGASVLLRLVIGWLRATPTFFADEYIYAELGRSLAETGRPLIRGASASFPALLQPLLTAPAWLVDDVETSFRLIQALGALAMSLAAVPVFLLARRLRLGVGISFALAALALVVPDMSYAAWVLAEPFAYPLALGAVAVGTVALARPGLRLQLAFLALAALATFARVQFAVLPLCFLAGILIVGLRDRRLRATLREQVVVVAAVLVPVVAFVAVGPSRALGFYEGILDLQLGSPELAKWFGADAMLLAFAAGIVLAPGAALGLWLAVHRPRSREELAFGALAAPFVVALLLEAAAYGIGGDRIQERYFFYAVPLVGILFALYASRGWPHRLVHGVLAAGLILLAARVPLSGFSAADGKTNSPTLYATARLEQIVGDVGTASLVLALGVALLAGVLVLASRRPRLATPLALGLALVVCATTYAGAVSFNLANAAWTRAHLLDPKPSFVDAVRRRRRRDAPHVVERARGRLRVPVLEPLRGRRLPPPRSGASRFLRRDAGDDRSRRHPPRSRRAGHQAARRRRLQRHRSLPRLRGDRHVARVRPRRLPRSATASALRSRPLRERLARALGQLPALAHPGRAEPRGDAGVRADRAGGRAARGRRVRAPRQAEGRGHPASGRDPPGLLPVCADGHWAMDFDAPSTGAIGARFVSVQASEPTYRPDPAACA